MALELMIRTIITTFLIVSVLVGCEHTSPGPPWRYPTTTLAGRVTFGGEPLEKGWMSLQPFGGTMGDHVIVPIQDGQLLAEKVPVGSLQIRIFLPNAAAQDILTRYPHLQARLNLIRDPGSPLEVVTRVDRPSSFTFDILTGQSGAKH